MRLEDYVESEVVIAVAATAAALSPRFRRALRRGAVYGVAGVLKASDVVTAAARGAAQGLSSQGVAPVAEDGDRAQSEPAKTSGA
jgi:hypothetical protein